MESRRFFFFVAQLYITPPPVVFTILGVFQDMMTKLAETVHRLDAKMNVSVWNPRVCNEFLHGWM